MSKFFSSIRLLITPKKVIIGLIVTVLAVAAIVPAVYFYNQYQKSQLLLQNPTLAAKEEIRQLTAKVGKLVEIPDEEPTVATVSDKDKLKDQAFFAKAVTGDKVLIYTQAKKAILYRPSLNKVIEIAPINIGEPTATASDSAQGKMLKVVLYNGTRQVGATKPVEKQLIEKFVNIEVVDKANAAKKNYEETLVIDLTGNFKPTAETLAIFLQGKTAPLPDGEKTPEADLLIIVGSNSI